MYFVISMQYQAVCISVPCSIESCQASCKEISAELSKKCNVGLLICMCCTIH